MNRMNRQTQTHSFEKKRRNQNSKVTIILTHLWGISEKSHLFSQGFIRNLCENKNLKVGAQTDPELKV